jgi:hypothetical protein
VLRDESFWLRASLAEALVGLSDSRGDGALDDAKAHARAAWMVETMLTQVQEVRRLQALLGEH